MTCTRSRRSTGSTVVHISYCPTPLRPQKCIIKIIIMPRRILFTFFFFLISPRPEVTYANSVGGHEEKVFVFVSRARPDNN